ncbi:rho GTPase-activating protein gacII-like isoform X2 [Abrus precatorius]|uniref:Rho GTPase-activating protein gacII-like isoform X2 n=1 Tax=Abrus precatorius TaxID=3816 RepID=A0A8B8JU60_ABRPR|nr:rho GTPase-activating protein gacII-like isoform X2 [Abrus precatorius]
MDSTNSGSMQSSSTAGDEEYDSRAESTISAFLNNNNNPPPPPPPPQPQPPPQQHVTPFTTNPSQHHHMFDPLSNYLDPTQRSVLNLDSVWSKVVRSEPNQPDLAGFIPSSSSPQNQAFVLSQLGGQTRGNVGAFPTTHNSLPPETASSRGGLLSVSTSNDQVHNNNSNNNMVRNPKKRSRASRRAPTTVLTTDTTNFRAMVQEFTGIPAPPFTSSPFPRTRLDLFATSSSSSAVRSLDPPTTPPPPYLLRPFAQKVQAQSSPIPPSFPPMIDALASNNNNNSCSSNPTSINYQQPINMHNPILSFQSILQTPPKYPQLGNNSSLLVASGTVDSHLKMGVLEELGLSHAHVNTHVGGGHHQNMVPSSSDGGALSRVNNNNNMRSPSLDWAQRVTNNDGGVLRSLGGTLNYRSNVSDQRVSNGKVNYSATPSDFHGDKGQDCVVVAAARSEGIQI